MSEPVWLDEPAVHELHDLGITKVGGPKGVRDPGLLFSATTRVAAGEFGLPDLAAWMRDHAGPFPC